MKHDDPELIIDRIIDKVGKDLIVGTPLAAGKPNLVLYGFSGLFHKDRLSCVRTSVFSKGDARKHYLGFSKRPIPE